MLNRSKGRINEEQKRALIDSAKKWGTSNLLLKNGKVYYNNNQKRYVTLGELKNYGYLEDKKIKNLINKSDIPDETKICINYKNNQFVYSINDDNMCESNYPIMMKRDTSKAFWQSTYSGKISTVDVLDNKNVPSNVVASWDVSEKQNKSVMAWIIDDPDNSGMYKLYIGGNGGVAAPTDSSNLFGGAYNSNFSKTKTMNLTNLDTSRVTNMGYMFYGCSSLTNLNVSNFDTSKVTNMVSMFWDCKSLTSLDLSNFDTSNVTDMGWMFYNCSSLTSLDVSKFNTSKVTHMTWMFYNCWSLTSLDVSKFNTSKVTDMGWMFNNCKSLTRLDVSNFDTSQVTSMSGMFNKCSSLINLDLSSFNTSNVKYMSSMFNGCNSLTSLDVSNFNTSNVTDMGWMFNNCSSLTSLKLCSFDTSNVTNMKYMFQITSKLTNIYVGPKWTTANATTTNMFLGSGVSAVTTNQC
ncbi:MAG: BspA family leucine-rich repeat surface protein [Bacilli bacterium]|nr:BspA family leucine-rich repeat surface protein [Bacilli bacterium]